LLPAGSLRNDALGRFLAFLTRNSFQEESRIEWFDHARYLLRTLLSTTKEEERAASLAVSDHLNLYKFEQMPTSLNVIIIAPGAFGGLHFSIVSDGTMTTISHEKPFRQRFCLASGCGAMFFICPYCDRGQRYCSDNCRQRSRLEQVRAASL